MGKRSRDKGRDYQSELARRWRDSGLYPDAHSTQGAQTKAVGKAPGDIGGVPWVCELKRAKKINVRAALEQAERDAAEAQDERTPIAVCRWDGMRAHEAVVSMRLADFEQLIRAQRDGWEAP